MTLRVGIDLVMVETVSESLRTHGDAYLTRIYTEREIADCRTGNDISAPRLAGRFAAKEAAIKALRMPPDRGVDWRSIEVVRAPDGWIELHLTGLAAELFAESRGLELAVSMTHEETFASAVVVAQLAER